MDIKDTALAAPAKPREWSAHQQGIFTFCVDGVGNANVIAVAGSGKSTTMAEAMRRILAVRPYASTILLTFGRDAAADLRSKGVNGRTFHSLCMQVVLRHKRQRDVVDRKLRNILEANLGDDELRMYGPFADKLVRLAKNAGIGCLVPDAEEHWVALAEHHAMELDHEEADYNRAIDLSRKLLRASNDDPTVDWDDILYLAVKDGLTLPKFDFVVVDEAQDTNAIQRAILRKLFKPKSAFNDTGTRLVCVGDPAQAIYGFRGADSDSMRLLSQEFNCIELPLTVTYRCPRTVVDYVKQWMPAIEAAPNAINGEVQNRGGQWDIKEFQPNDLVLCRTTAPLVALLFALMRNRTPAKLKGRDTGKTLVNLVNRMKAKGIENLTAKLNKWLEREVQKAVAKKDEAKAEALTDKVMTILFLIDTLPETNRTVPALINVLETLFVEDKANTSGMVTLSTIHKAKGLEAERVWWLNRSKCPAKWARTEWQAEQEVHLCYVAGTRAKQVLFMIEEKAEAVGESPTDPRVQYQQVEEEA